MMQSADDPIWEQRYRDKTALKMAYESSVQLYNDLNKHNCDRLMKIDHTALKDRTPEDQELSDLIHNIHADLQLIQKIIENTACLSNRICNMISDLVDKIKRLNQIFADKGEL